MLGWAGELTEDRRMLVQRIDSQLRWVSDPGGSTGSASAGTGGMSEPRCGSVGLVGSTGSCEALCSLLWDSVSRCVTSLLLLYHLTSKVLLF